MKRIFCFFWRLNVMLLAVVAFAGCSGHGRAIGEMVDSLNSEEMQRAERQTGLFTGSEAEIEGDTLSITFNLVDGLSVAGVAPSQLPALRESAVDEFRSKLADRRFADGLQALEAEGMVMKLLWKDTAGHSVALTVNPSEVLDKKGR
jgi:hypothetical protein